MLKGFCQLVLFSLGSLIAFPPSFPLRASRSPWLFSWLRIFCDGWRLLRVVLRLCCLFFMFDLLFFGLAQNHMKGRDGYTVGITFLFTAYGRSQA